MTGNEPICVDCHFWRDYRYDIEQHPDYDGHCWFKGIMTLWVAECDQHNKPLDISDFRPLEFPEPKPKLSPEDYVPNQWRDWEKKTFLKRNYARMTGNDYQRLAMRTNDGKSYERLVEAFGSNRDIDMAGLLMGCLGLAGESGELLDLFKKWIFHSKPLDDEHAKKELGDVLWYVAEIAYSLGWNLDEIMAMNIDKLKARYPEGFSAERSNHRAEGDL